MFMAKEKIYGTCLYCETHQELQRSHTINRTFFKELYKNCGNTNAARVISLSSDIVKNTNDNWTDYLLCAVCESYFNQHFDGYGAKALRGKISKQVVSRTSTKVIYLNTDTTNIILYILSLYWRGAKSKHYAYDSLKTYDGIHYFLKNTFAERKWNETIINIKVSVLYDGLGTLSEEKIKQMMISPFTRIYKKSKAFSFLFLIEGFLIEIYFGKLTYSIKKKGEWMKPNYNCMKCDLQNLHDIPELHKIFGHFFIANRNMRLKGISHE